MQQQEKIVLGVSLVVTLMAGWVQVGEADDVAERSQQACFLIERGQTTNCSAAKIECIGIAAQFGCDADNLSGSDCIQVAEDHYVLRCEFEGT
ncbi:MAG: hypothetical protein U0974_11370 [Gemmatimonadales bacterium]|nr:hypothetical protein [Gemmatimonadales bacterium]MDZ4390313.1 hypothetical protein [Gemmatimonadales bacterium]